MEPLSTLNQRLTDKYGLFEDGRPLWKIIWSDDEHEIRYDTFPKYSSEGVWLSEVREFREVQKYSYVHHHYILERLLPVPLPNLSELTESTSYEPVWVFNNSQLKTLTPNWEAIEYLIHTVYEAAAHSIHAKYKLPEIQNNSPEAITERINLVQKELFGNESPIGDSLMDDSAIGYGIRKRNDS